MLQDYLAAVREQGVDVHVLFLDAKTETLVKRFSETRRRHPLSDGERTLPECIGAERELLRRSRRAPPHRHQRAHPPIARAPGSRISCRLDRAA